MSTYWRLACFDCERDYNEVTINHGDKWLEAMIDFWRGAKDAIRAVDDISIVIWCYEFPRWWFEIHDGHNIGIANEYGDAYTYLGKGYFDVK